MKKHDIYKKFIKESIDYLCDKNEEITISNIAKYIKENKNNIFKKNNMSLNVETIKRKIAKTLSNEYDLEYFNIRLLSESKNGAAIYKVFEKITQNDNDNEDEESLEILLSEIKEEKDDAINMLKNDSDYDDLESLLNDIDDDFDSDDDLESLLDNSNDEKKLNLSFINEDELSNLLNDNSISNGCKYYNIVINDALKSINLSASYYISESSLDLFVSDLFFLKEHEKTNITNLFKDVLFAHFLKLNLDNLRERKKDYLANKEEKINCLLDNKEKEIILLFNDVRKKMENLKNNEI